MNVIDIILVLVVLFALWNGISRGFLIGIASLVSWVGSLVLTFWLYPYLARFVEVYIMDNVWTVPLSFLTTLLFTGTILSLLVNHIVQRIPQAAHTNLLNRWLGIIPGFITGILYAAVIATLLLLFPLSAALTAHTRESVWAQRLTAGLEQVEQPFAPAFQKAVNRSVNKMTIAPESTERVRLPFTVANPTPRPDLESQMLQLINEARKKVDLSPLQHDEELTPVAREHAADMFANGYFSHISPDGSTPFDRIRRAKITFLAAGENLALAQTLPLAHEGLMNSPGHRENILRPAFGRVGIGVLDGGVYGLMVTQNFRN
ncbi:CvpA family protein [Parapedobacter sp. ISTM3]|uniref:CvpA family protein n=1 Tax=Parapedobacter sp. ISTM3 TaxID=2800130 RepID=UPI00190346DD|nr:CvpA family protein [Parapedobacter sp. ISTM3]MBK1441582.1 CvpA family protein [Parapedobacter sp. ISTM3]